jgi:hypothetical protein
MAATQNTPFRSHNGFLGHDRSLSPRRGDHHLYNLPQQENSHSSRNQPPPEPQPAPVTPLSSGSNSWIDDFKLSGNEDNPANDTTETSLVPTPLSQQGPSTRGRLIRKMAVDRALGSAELMIALARLIF